MKFTIKNSFGLMNHVSYHHRIGNMIGAMLSIMDSVIIICTLGYIHSMMSGDFSLYKLRSGNFRNKKG